MAYILSAQRDSMNSNERDEAFANYKHQIYMKSAWLPPNALDIARSDWWYAFDCPKAPHDATLVAFRMGDELDEGENNVPFTGIDLTLESAHGGLISLRYPQVFDYELTLNPDGSVNHGDWRYDEFSCAEVANRFVHTIEWANGGKWKIEASDLIHSFDEEDPSNRVKLPTKP